MLKMSDRFFKAVFLQLSEFRYRNEGTQDERFRIFSWIGFWLATLVMTVYGFVQNWLVDMNQYWVDEGSGFRDPRSKWFIIPLVVYMVSGIWLMLRLKGVAVSSIYAPGKIFILYALALIWIGCVISSRYAIPGLIGLSIEVVTGCLLARKYWNSTP